VIRAHSSGAFFPALEQARGPLPSVAVVASNQVRIKSRDLSLATRDFSRFVENLISALES
jgi:hypothetical protein